MIIKTCSSYFIFLVIGLSLINPYEQATITEMWTRIPNNCLKDYSRITPRKNSKLSLHSMTTLSLLENDSSQSFIGVGCNGAMNSCQEIFKKHEENLCEKDPQHDHSEIVAIIDPDLINKEFSLAS